MRRKGDFYYLLEGSMISPVVSKFKGNTALKLRETHKALIGKGHKLRADIPFPSSTAASSFVIGYNATGGNAWIEPNSGLTLDDYDKKVMEGE